MERLADELHAAGCNVLVPLMPRNGLADHQNDGLHQLTAPTLATYGEEAIDIAAGLGERVVALGLSANRIVAAWLAQHRAEVRRAVERYEFPAELGLPHDLIDPLQAGQRVELTYPVLTEFLLRS